MLLLLYPQKLPPITQLTVKAKIIKLLQESIGENCVSFGQKILDTISE